MLEVLRKERVMCSMNNVPSGLQWGPGLCHWVLGSAQESLCLKIPGTFLPGPEVSLMHRPREVTLGVLREQKLLCSLEKGPLWPRERARSLPVGLRTCGLRAKLPEQLHKSSHIWAHKDRVKSLLTELTACPPKAKYSEYIFFLKPWALRYMGEPSTNHWQRDHV